jgi:hypothetical protein
MQFWSPRIGTGQCRRHRALLGVADRISYIDISTTPQVCGVITAIPGDQRSVQDNAGNDDGQNQTGNQAQD